MLLTAFLAFCGACNTPPAVTITAPQTGGLFTATPVAVTGTIVDDKGVVSATLTNGSTTYPLTFGAGGEFTQAVDLSQDDNLIVVTGVDAEDASGTASLFIGYAGPVAIQITSPPDGATVNADKVTVSGTLSNPDTLVTVNGVRAVVGSGTFSAFGVPLIPGANPMTALAMHPRFRDVVGTASATVQTAHAREAVKLLATTLQGEPPLAVDFSLTVDTDNPIVNYKWDLDADGVWEIDSPSQNTASATFTQARVYNARVLLTDSQGTGLSDVVPIRVQGPAQQGGSFASGSPSDIVRRQDRTYLVLDSASCTVTGYDAEGLPTGFAFGSCGSGDGEFQGPMGLAVNPSTGAIYVADTGNHRVQKFDAQGNFIFAFSS